MENYIKEHTEKIQDTPGGKLCQVFGLAEGASCSIALVEMKAKNYGLKHYHDNITEIYLFSKGEGNIVINENNNKIKQGECYIIPPNNVHYILANTNMEFACICTPPWTEKHEISVINERKGNNILPINIENGVIQKLGPEEEHCIEIYNITNSFMPNQNKKKYRRVYYFIKGNGSIIIDDKKSVIKPGDCYEITESSNEIVQPEGKLKFVLVCDIF